MNIQKIIDNSIPCPENKTFWTGIAPDIRCVEIERYQLKDGIVVPDGKHYLEATAEPHEVAEHWGGGIAIATPFVEVVQTGNILSVVHRGYDNLRVNEA